MMGFSRVLGVCGGEGREGMGREDCKTRNGDENREHSKRTTKE